MAHDHRTRNADQAQRLRQLVSQSSSLRPVSASRSHVVAVASGKGGVGKTLIAANLAIALAGRGHRVILFDLDMGLANTDIVLGIDTPATWSDVLAGRRSLDEVITQGPGQIAFVAGASGVADLANLSEFQRHQLVSLMERVEDRYDVVILDCGAGISRNVVGFGAMADTALVVATPEPTAITDAYAMIKAFAQERTASEDGTAGASIGTIINMVENRREGRETYERLAGVAARFLHLPVTDYGCILRDDHVPAAVRQRAPVVLRYPRSAASAGVMGAAERLSRELGRPQGGHGLFYRVINMFM